MRLTLPIALSLPYTPEDVYGIARISKSVLFSNELAELRYSKTTPEEQIDWLFEETRHELQETFKKRRPAISAVDDLGKDVDRFEYLLILDENLAPLVPDRQTSQHGASHRGRIVGHAAWSYYTGNSVTHDENQQQPSAGPEPPASANIKLVHHLNDLVNNVVRFHIRGKRCYVLDDIATLRSHQRKGIAKKLVKWIFPFADRDGLPVMLASSPMGFPLYKACGFEEIGGERGAAEVNRGDWSGSGVHRHIMMIRHPKATIGKEVGSS